MFRNDPPQRHRPPRAPQLLLLVLALANPGCQNLPTILQSLGAVTGGLAQGLSGASALGNLPASPFSATGPTGAATNLGPLTGITGATVPPDLQPAAVPPGGVSAPPPGGTSTALAPPPAQAVEDSLDLNQDQLAQAGDPATSPPQGLSPCGESVGLVGDSITANSGYPQALQELCPGSRFTNAPSTYAFVGKSTPAMVRDFDAVLRGGHDTLVILGGINNIADPAQVEGDLRTMYSRAKAQGLRVIAGTLMPYGGYSSWTPTRAENVRRVNEFIRSQAGSLVDSVADFFAATQDPNRPDFLRSDLTNDSLHPNAAGYRIMAQTLFPTQI